MVIDVIRPMSFAKVSTSDRFILYHLELSSRREKNNKKGANVTAKSLHHFMNVTNELRSRYCAQIELFLFLKIFGFLFSSLSLGDLFFTKRDF